MPTAPLSAAGRRLRPGRGRRRRPPVQDRHARQRSSPISTLGEGAIYHPGGIDYDGTHIWVPVAEYRPNSRSIVYRVDPETMKATEVFRFADHIGGIVHDTDDRYAARRELGLAALLSLDARRGRPGHRTPTSPPETLRTLNPSHYVDYQDCKYAGAASHALHRRRRRCARRPGAPAFRLGGIDLVSLADGRPLHQVPVPLWTASGLDMTHNPVWLEPTRDRAARLFHARGRSVDALRLRGQVAVGGRRQERSRARERAGEERRLIGIGEHRREVLRRERAGEARRERLAQHPDVVLDVVVARVASSAAPGVFVGRIRRAPPWPLLRAVDADALADASTSVRPLASIASYGELARAARASRGTAPASSSAARATRRRGRQLARAAARATVVDVGLAHARDVAAQQAARARAAGTPRRTAPRGSSGTPRRAARACRRRRAARSSSARATASPRSGRRTRAARAAAAARRPRRRRAVRPLRSSASGTAK